MASYPSFNAGTWRKIGAGVAATLGVAGSFWWGIGAPGVPSGGDTTPPTVSVTAPSSGATVSGTAQTVSATCSDNVACVGVQFKLDGANLGSEDLSSPYQISWDTTTATNATHTITAVGYDAVGNSTTSAGVTLTVNNGGGAPSGTANLWVDGNGGTCTRSASLVAYVDAAACGSLSAALTAASCGDTVDVIGGTYGAQSFSGSGCASGAQVTLQPAPSATVNLASVSIAGGTTEALLTGMNVQSGGQVLFTGGTSVTIQNFTAPFFDVQGGNTITIKGGTYGSCQATSTSYNCVARLIGTNQTIDGVTIYGINSSAPASFHTEDVFVRGCTSCTIRNSTFYDSYPSDVFVQNCCSLSATTNLTIENNWFGAPYSDTSSPYRDNHGKALEVDTSTPGLIVRHNSFYGWCNSADSNKCAGGMVCTGDDTTYGKTGTECGSVASPAQIYGNLMENGANNTGCGSAATYNYNLVMPFSSGSGQTLCGATDQKFCTSCGAGGNHFPYTTDPVDQACAPPYLSSQTYVACTGPINYTITGPTWAGDGFVTNSSYCLPSTDHSGNARPSVNCDAGASER